MMFVRRGSDNISVPIGQNGSPMSTHPTQFILASADGNLDSPVTHNPGWHGRHNVTSYLAMKMLSAVDVFYFWDQSLNMLSSFRENSGRLYNTCYVLSTCHGRLYSKYIYYN